jgi:hypothetical protein
MGNSTFVGLAEAAMLLASPALTALPPADLAGAANQDKVRSTAMHSSLHDFDFFMGNWRVHHRRLKERLAGCHEWVEFEGTTTVQKILGGFGNMDDNVLDKPGGVYRAVSLRTFDPKASRWSIWWFDGRYPAHLDPPVVGGFENGVGSFYADDTFDGKPIRMRFIWSRTDTAAPRWEQAFSTDGGKSWETNWIMDFTRA